MDYAAANIPGWPKLPAQRSSGPGKFAKCGLPSCGCRLGGVGTKTSKTAGRRDLRVKGNKLAPDLS
jgi:hypothetical protein